MASSSRRAKRDDMVFGSVVADAAQGRADTRVQVLSHEVGYGESDRIARKDRSALHRKVALCLVAVAAVSFLSLCFMGAQGQYYPYGGAYATYTPYEVLRVIYYHAYNAFGTLTHMFTAYPVSWLSENVAGYYAIPHKAQVVGITLLCGVLLTVSGMLYQAVFKNPIAGPSMLGVSSGTSIGTTILVLVYGASATSMVGMRYLLCYGCGAAVLLIVVLAGRALSGKGRPFDIMSMMLVGSMLSSLLGTIVSFITLFLMDEEDYLTYYSASEMLTVDTSMLSWIVLGIAVVASILPIYLLRFSMNSLSFDEEEAKLFGVNVTLLRTVALLCGGIMILAAQVHVGMVGLVTTIVPFISRALFGSEFRHQLAGNVCIGMLLLVICRTIVDMVPFVGNGLSLGSFVSVVVLPLFLIIVSRNMHAWE